MKKLNVILVFAWIFFMSNAFAALTENFYHRKHYLDEKTCIDENYQGCDLIGTLYFANCHTGYKEVSASSVQKTGGDMLLYCQKI